MNAGASGGDGGVEHGARLLAFTDAVMGDDPEALRRERQALRALLSDEAFVDTCATIGAFHVVDRIADATGIPLDDGMRKIGKSVWTELGLARFGSSANTLARASAR